MPASAAREGGPARAPGRGREGAAAPAPRGDLREQRPAPRGGIRTPIPDLGGLRHPDDPRLAFLGTGAFGGRWSTSGARSRDRGHP